MKERKEENISILFQNFKMDRKIIFPFSNVFTWD